MNHIMRTLSGYLWIEIRGFSPERFFNLCSKNGIELWEISFSDKCYRCYISCQDYRSCRPYAKKAKVRLPILKKFGLPFFLYRNRKRKLYAVGVALFFACLFLLSLFVWDIKIEGNSFYTYDTLLRFFKTRDIDYGVYKYGISCDQLEADLRSGFSEITWVSARVSGTRFLVKIKENEVLSEVSKEEKKSCNLVAEKAGTITRMVVRRGKAMVSIGDQVEPGQILVSGILEVTDDSGTVVNSHEVQADAEIYAETMYEYQENIPNWHQMVYDTGKKTKGFYVRIGKESFVWKLPHRKIYPWKHRTEEYQAKLFSDFYLPVYGGILYGKEYDFYEACYRTDEKLLEAEKYEKRFLENLIEKGVQIIENNVKILEGDLSFVISGSVKTVEEIGQEEEIIAQSGLEENGKTDERN